MKNEMDAFTKRRLEKSGEVLNRDHLAGLIETINSLLKTIHGKGRGSEIFLMHQKNVSLKTDSDLISLANQSDTTKWKTSPLFYSALIDELRKRNII